MKPGKNILLPFLLLLCCSSFAGGNKRVIASIEILCAKKTVRPGDVIDFDIEVTRKNGNTYKALYFDFRSKNLKTKQHWADFTIHIKGANASAGKLYINRDLRTYGEGNKIEISITHKEREEIKKTITLNIELNGETNFQFGGGKGVDGAVGESGVRWFDTNGGNGKPGGNGANGDNGDNIVVYMKPYFMQTNPDTFVRVFVRSVNRDTSIVFLHNISKFSIRISASGGNGGEGGKGGRGRDGRDARDETEKKSGSEAGDGGDGGPGGNGGKGGNAGTMTVYIEESIYYFTEKMSFYNFGGMGGKGNMGGEGGTGGTGTAHYAAGKNGVQGPSGKNGENGSSNSAPVIISTPNIILNY